jgi:hypothetical protein
MQWRAARGQPEHCCVLVCSSSRRRAATCVSTQHEDRDGRVSSDKSNDSRGRRGGLGPYYVDGCSEQREESYDFSSVRRDVFLKHDAPLDDAAPRRSRTKGRPVPSFGRSEEEIRYRHIRDGRVVSPKRPW